MTLSTNKPSKNQGAIGLALAATILLCWLIGHVVGVFLYKFGTHSWLTAPLLIALQCWLYVGLFIVAHDCMHGSLVPYRPSVNRVIGQLCLFLYAGFSFDALKEKHHQHHEAPGTDKDPDFSTQQRHSLLGWYFSFFVQYFSIREFAIISAVSSFYLYILNVSVANLLLFWALPGILSSFQLFYFGTYLPHRPADQPFADHHNARSGNYSWFMSLITCFHFGLHHEHHLRPSVPWWGLPTVRERLRRQ